MRKIAKQQDQDGAEIDLTPMLDVVFIMLIFFIVVASFIKEAGVEVNRPDDNQPDDPEDSSSILVEVASDNQIWMENRRVDIRAVRANIQRLLAEDPEAPVTIKVEKGAEAGIVVDVADVVVEIDVCFLIVSVQMLLHVLVSRIDVVRYYVGYCLACLRILAKRTQ